MRRSSVLATSLLLRSLRKRLRLLPPVRCRLPGLPRFRRPLFVMRSRFAAPLFVFSLGMDTDSRRFGPMKPGDRRGRPRAVHFSGGARRRRRRGALLVREQDRHALALVGARALDLREVLEVVDEALQERFAAVLVHDLAASEHEADLHLVALLEELLRVPELDLVVVLLGLGAQTH